MLILSVERGRMAMAALLVATPSGRAMSTSIAQTRFGIQIRRTDDASKVVNVGRRLCCFRDSEAAVAPRERGSEVSCCADTSRASVSSRNAELSWSASGLVRFDDKRLGIKRNRVASRRLALRIAAEKTDFTNVAGTLLRLGRQGLDTGTKFIPESVPRPVAQVLVGLAGVVVGSFLLRSLFSTVSFILAIGAVSYAGYFLLTKGESSRSSSSGFDSGSSGKPKSTDEALEEARKIMEKYK